VNIGSQLYWLTVSAFDVQMGPFGYEPLFPDIYIDDVYVGTGSVSVQVLQGSHSVYLDDPTWNAYHGYGVWSGIVCFSDYPYGNGDFRTINSNTGIDVYYY
jgi:hypothetical protein